MPPEPNTSRRLADLLIEPHETLEIELKGWLDIENDGSHKAVLAKSLIALANHGGGFVIVGFDETPTGGVPAPNRPTSLGAYIPDTVNAVVLAYAEPPFHCDVNIVAAPDGLQYPIITVPGGHRRPIRSKRDGPNGQTVKANSYYTRRPGPQSEVPQSGAEWDALIGRSITNGREDLLNQFRGILSGQGPTEPPPSERDQTEAWFASSMARWTGLIKDLPPKDERRLPLGHFAVGYNLIGSLREIRLPELKDAITRAKVRHTGWPEFWVPSRAEIQPYLHDGNIECWLGRENKSRDAAHSDFWRISPKGEAFLIRGLQEDAARDRFAPGKIFDITLPTWRVGEALLHASNMARELGDPQARIVMVSEYAGLRGRHLDHMEGTRMISEGYVAQQDSIRTNITVQADQVSDALPELVGKLITPVYELFDFFTLPASLVTQELKKMRSNSF
jgi:hypothetical protein